MLVVDRNGFSSYKSFRVYVLSDLHIGNAAASIPSIERAIKDVQQDPRGFAVLWGDLVEGIYIHDKRFQSDVHAGKLQTANAQVKMVSELLKPIAKKILYGHAGTHEPTINETFKIMEAIKDLMLPYNENIVMSDHVSCSCRLMPDMYLYSHHGAGRVHSTADDEDLRYSQECRSVVKKLVPMPCANASVAGMGHIHKSRIKSPVTKTYVYAEDGDIKQEIVTSARTAGGNVTAPFRWYFSNPSFLRTTLTNALTYSEKRMYGAVELGYSIINYKNGKVDTVEPIIM